MKVKLYYGASCGQDHNFFKAEGNILNVVFEVDESFGSVDKYKLIAEGYGAIGDYGNGAIYVAKANVYSIGGRGGVGGIVSREDTLPEYNEMVIKEEDCISVVGEKESYDVKVFAGDKDISKHIAEATIKILFGKPITMTVVFEPVDIKIDIFKKEITALLMNGAVIKSKNVKIGECN